MSTRFTIVVNSCDAYEDCWAPFFLLFSKYWPNCNSNIILNTETKSFQFPGLDITCPTVCKNDEKNYLWGERLLRCLDKVETDIVLIFLDDYFIKSPVKVVRILELVDLMYKDNLSHILLVNAPGPNKQSHYPMLLQRGHHAPYRFSLQVGLWHKERIKFYLRKYENPWQSELWGTKRAWRVRDSFFCIDRVYLQTHGNIVDYDDTGGIARGEWLKDKVIPLFHNHNIDVDFSKRGFYNHQMEKEKFMSKLKRKFCNLPAYVKFLTDLYFKMNLSNLSSFWRRYG